MTFPPNVRMGVGVLATRQRPFDKSSYVEQYLLLHNRERNNWEFPGGKVEPGEDLATAAARELYEETGWDFRDHDINHVAGVFSNPTADKNTLVFVMFRFALPPHWKKDVQLSGEHDDAQWKTKSEISSLPKEKVAVRLGNWARHSTPHTIFHRNPAEWPEYMPEPPHVGLSGRIE